MNALVYTIPQVAQMFKVCATTIKQRIRRGEIQTIHIGRSVRIPQASVNRMLKPENITPQAMAIAKSIMEARG